MKLILLFVAVLAVGVSQAQQQEPTAHHVVIGAFRVLDNATRFTSQASRTGFPAQYALQPDRKLYYVYIFTSAESKKAYNALIKLKVETVYKDAWVYSGKLGEEVVAEVTPAPEPVKKPPVEVAPEVKPVVKPKDTVAATPPKKDSVIQVVEKPAEVVEKPKPAEVVKKPDGRPYLFRLTSTDGKELLGSVELVESSAATKFLSVRSGEITYLTPPHNNQGTYSGVASVAGYKETNFSIAYNDANPEKGPQGEVIISLSLPKAKRGDYIDFRKVSFFKNTSVLQPESQNELDGVVNLLKESTGYTIRIHGHCNGKQDRESYLMGTSTQFFAMDPSGNTKVTISSKELSLARAETVKAYLVKEGIEASRIATKGEGGRIPLYPEGGTLGVYNDRIEIEFTKN